MNGLPLHPMLVHLPLALAALVPLAALVALAAQLRGRPARGLGVAVAVLQLLLALGAVAALRSGEAEEDRVERVVPDAAMESHEEAAEGFLVAAWITAGLSLVPAIWASRRGVALAGAAVTLAASAAVLALGIRVGEAGAALVYRHGAAAAYSDTSGAPADAPVSAADYGDDD